MGKIYSKYISEFRFLPMATFLDVRGKMVEKMLGGFLDKWTTSSNRVDVLNKKSDSAAFISVGNCGFATVDKSEFSLLTQAIEDGLSTLSVEPKYMRLGFRETSVVETKKTFEQLVKSFKTNMLGEIPTSVKNSNLTLYDLAIIYNFRSDNFNLNIHIGPMEKEQAKSWFDEENLPENSIFIDIDYFIENPRASRFKVVKRFVKEASQTVSQFRDKVAKIVEVDNE